LAGITAPLVACSTRNEKRLPRNRTYPTLRLAQKGTEGNLSVATHLAFLSRRSRSDRQRRGANQGHGQPKRIRGGL